LCSCFSLSGLKFWATRYLCYSHSSESNLFWDWRKFLALGDGKRERSLKDLVLLSFIPVLPWWWGMDRVRRMPTASDRTADCLGSGLARLQIVCVCVGGGGVALHVKWTAGYRWWFSAALQSLGISVCLPVHISRPQRNEFNFLLDTTVQTLREAKIQLLFPLLRNMLQNQKIVSYFNMYTSHCIWNPSRCVGLSQQRMRFTEVSSCGFSDDRWPVCLT
jgi:hypothetical protein